MVSSSKDISQGGSTTWVAMIAVVAAIAITVLITRPAATASSFTPLSGLTTLKTMAAESVPYGDAIATPAPTLIEFYADWCDTCKVAGPELAKAVELADGVVLRRINIKSYKSPVARQHRIKKVPHLMLCDDRGKVLEQGSGVMKTIRKRHPSAKAKPGK